MHHMIAERLRHNMLNCCPKVKNKKCMLGSPICDRRKNTFIFQLKLHKLLWETFSVLTLWHSSVLSAAIKRNLWQQSWLLRTLWGQTCWSWSSTTGAAESPLEHLELWTTDGCFHLKVNCWCQGWNFNWTRRPNKMIELNDWFSF